MYTIGIYGSQNTEFSTTTATKNPELIRWKSLRAFISVHELFLEW
jgi:hypothetical protein